VVGATAAIFDVDGTLVHGGTERLFFRFLVRTGRLPASRALGFLLRLAASPRGRYRNKTYLAGMAVAEARHLGRRCFQDMIQPRLRSRALACLAAHQGRGHQIVLLTGSLAFLAQPLKELVGADWLIATELVQQGGRFTGDLDGLHPRGENKRVLLEELARQQGLDLASSWAYGDHEEDVAVLECVGRPVAVNPTRTLRREARRRGWPMAYF
jgi:HAD superfamily hydrolase (TIGR01490 family)